MFEYWKTPEYARLLHEGLDARCAAAILKEGCETFAEFVAKNTEQNLLRIPGIGAKSADKIKAVAAAKGLRFRDDLLKPNVRPIAPPKRVSTLPEPEPVWTGPKWEYLVVDRPFANSRETTQKRLNEYGQLGWEISRAGRHAIIFKRQAQ